MTTQKVAWPTMIVNRPNGISNVTNVVRSAMPVTTPGSAIGRMNRNEIVWRPKNEYRWTASAASVPRTSARAVATVATMIELTNAEMRVGFDAASPNHLNVKPVGGQAWERLSLKARTARIPSGR